MTQNPTTLWATTFINELYRAGLRHVCISPGSRSPLADKPIAGRLGDITQPLMRVAMLLPKEALEALSGLVLNFESERKDAESESLAGRIAQALYDIRDDVENGRISVETLRGKLNEGVHEKFHVAPQTVGKELSAMGIERKKTGGNMHILFNQEVMDKIWDRFIPGRGSVPNLPNLPNLPKSSRVSLSDGEAETENLPDLPENREDGEKAKTNLPAATPYEIRDRETREEREESSGQWEVGVI